MKYDIWLLSYGSIIYSPFFFVLGSTRLSFTKFSYSFNTSVIISNFYSKAALWRIFLYYVSNISKSYAFLYYLPFFFDLGFSFIQYNFLFYSFYSNLVELF